MWTIKKEAVSNNVEKYQIAENGNPLTFQMVIDLFQTSTKFTIFFNDILANCPFNAFFWEVLPIQEMDLNESFEFVLVASLSLSNVIADEFTFEEYFDSDAMVVTFPNLSGDSQLIVPTNHGQVEDYSHIANFVRNAPSEQIHQFWKTVATEYQMRIGAETKWLSTSGLGVYWLHVRIDSRPKYYTHRPYVTYG